MKCTLVMRHISYGWLVSGKEISICKYYYSVGHDLLNMASFVALLPHSQIQLIQ